MSFDAILSQKLAQLKYSNKQPAKNDLLAALNQFNELRPEQKSFTFPDGKSSQLLTLTGTIPVHFQGAKYNIPICIYLFPGHPYTAPLVFVEPTSTMMIKPGRHVDDKGRVYLPYLTDWKYPQYETQGLISTLCILFGEQPPVYSRVSNYQPPSYPTSQGMGMPLPGGGMPMPGGGMPMPGSGMPMPGGYGAPYPSAGSGGVPPYPAAVVGSALPPYSGGSTGYMPYPNVSPMVTERPAGNVPARQAAGLTDDEVRVSLISAVQEKLTRRVKEVFEMGKHEIEDLETTRCKLEQGREVLRETITRISTEQRDIESNISLLKQKNADMEATIRRMASDSESMNIDEAVISTAPLYNQILQLYAEENAIEDAIYYLNEALRKDVIDLELFQKTVRQCSRNQFILRATLLKARKTAGLSDASGF